MQNPQAEGETNPPKVTEPKTLDLEFLHFVGLHLRMKQKRTLLMKEQTDILLKHFEKDPRPDYYQSVDLAIKTGLTDKQVKTWFNNRRRKMRTLAKDQERQSALDSKRRELEFQQLMAKLGANDTTRIATSKQGEAVNVNPGTETVPSNTSEQALSQQVTNLLLSPEWLRALVKYHEVVNPLQLNQLIEQQYPQKTLNLLHSSPMPNAHPFVPSISPTNIFPPVETKSDFSPK